MNVIPAPLPYAWGQVLSSRPDGGLMRLSRRSTYLLLFGVLLVAYGLAVHDAPQSVSLPIYATVPTTVQGWAWVACGGVAFGSVLVPRVPRAAGYAATVLPLALWALGFAALWLDTWAARAWQGALIWGVLAALAIIASGDEDVQPNA